MTAGKAKKIRRLNGKVTISIYISRELAKSLSVVADAEERSISQLAAMLLEKGIAPKIETLRNDAKAQSDLERASGVNEQ